MNVRVLYCNATSLTVALASCEMIDLQDLQYSYRMINVIDLYQPRRSSAPHHATPVRHALHSVPQHAHHQAKQSQAAQARRRSGNPRDYCICLCITLRSGGMKLYKSTENKELPLASLCKYDTIYR